MSSPLASPYPNFHRELASESGRTLILSTCLKCGATNKCSIMDHSLELWEKSHRCEIPPAQDDSQDPEVAPLNKLFTTPSHKQRSDLVN
jgi:hypothetical protein